jgi:hypothetical protein
MDTTFFDDGKLGSEKEKQKQNETKQITLATGLVFVECLKEIVRLQPNMKPHVLQLQELALQVILSSSSSSSSSSCTLRLM